VDLDDLRIAQDEPDERLPAALEGAEHERNRRASRLRIGALTASSAHDRQSQRESRPFNCPSHW
jgi:hypothetical protein